MQETETIKAKKTRKRKVNWVIGVDVSKCTLDYAIMHHDKFLFHYRGKNDKEEILKFIIRLKEDSKIQMASVVFCMEATGRYGQHLLFAIKKLKGRIAVVNPLIIKNFLGIIRGKNDKTDAIRIAQYAQKNLNDLVFWTPQRIPLLELKHLFALRERMLTTVVALSTPLKEQKDFIPPSQHKQILKLCAKSIEAIHADLMNIDALIDQIIKTDELINRLMTLIVSVPGVGRITALLILICTNEFKDISCPKKFACYAGVAPFKRESGQAVRKSRVSNFANKKMKSLLHLCALSAVRFDSEMKAYLERKTTQDGKPKLIVINAVRCKLIGRVFACVHQDRMFEKNYLNKKEITAAELD